MYGARAFPACANRIFYHMSQKSMKMHFYGFLVHMIEYFVRARAKNARAPKIFEVSSFSWNSASIMYFQNFHIVWIDCCNGLWRLYFFVKILKFFWKSSKFFEILKIFEKIEFLKKIFKLQSALKNLLFELWSDKKNFNEIFQQTLRFWKKF